MAKKGEHLSEETKKKISESNKGEKFPRELYPNYGLRKIRANQIFPMKDTKIELKIQNFLKELKIEFLTHQYMHIEHGYQCDIFIPVQKGIKQKTIIECYGEFFHCNLLKYKDDFTPFPSSKNRLTAEQIWERDIARIHELREAGFRVLVFWENEIKVMELNDLKMELIL